MRILMLVLCLSLAAPAFSQSEEGGWTLNGRLQGSFNDAGQILKAEPSIGYDVNRHFGISAGLPIYFVKNSTTNVETGLGNATLGFVLDLNNPALHYTSNLVFTAPTGDRDKGFSTGHVTVDWTNTFSRSFSSFTPFASLGVANTVSDTSFFVRPFSTDGVVSHFEGGGIYSLNSIFSTGVSGYAVRARGEQEIIVREPTGRSGQTRTQVIQPTANDHGVSAWLSVVPAGKLDYIVGYSRSSAYDLDSLFFGIGFRLK